MQTQPIIDNADRYERLPPVERMVPSHAPSQANAGQPGGDTSFAVDVADVAAAGVEVRYGLDPVANVWVAAFFDGSTGEFVKTVPATKVMDQLAELRAIFERSVDKRA